jgi:hypothetical protein
MCPYAPLVPKRCRQAFQIDRHRNLSQRVPLGSQRRACSSSPRLRYGRLGARRRHLEPALEPPPARLPSIGMSSHFTKRPKATRAERRLSARFERHHPTMLLLSLSSPPRCPNAPLPDSRHPGSGALPLPSHQRSAHQDPLLFHARPVQCAFCALVTSATSARLNVAPHHSRFPFSKLHLELALAPAGSGLLAASTSSTTGS